LFPPHQCGKEIHNRKIIKIKGRFFGRGRKNVLQFWREEKVEGLCRPFINRGLLGIKMQRIAECHLQCQLLIDDHKCRRVVGNKLKLGLAQHGEPLQLLLILNLELFGVGGSGRRFGFGQVWFWGTCTSTHRTREAIRGTRQQIGTSMVSRLTAVDEAAEEEASGFVGLVRGNVSTTNGSLSSSERPNSFPPRKICDSSRIFWRSWSFVAWARRNAFFVPITTTRISLPS